MRYKAEDPYFKSFKVELNGVIQSNVAEADDNEGWVRIEKLHGAWGRSWTERKKLYGRVFIVRFPELDEEPEPDVDESNN